MLNAVLKQFPWAIALFVLGPIAGHLTGSLRGADGSHDATILVTTMPVRGVAALVFTLAAALAVGLFGARVNGCRSGLNAAGIVLVWAASQTAAIDEILRRAQSPGPLIPLAIEGLIAGLLVVPLAAVVWQAGLGRGTYADAHPLPADAPPLRRFITSGPVDSRDVRGEHHSLAAALVRAVTRPAGVGAVAITVAAGVLVSWLVCQDTLKGQAIFAAALTGIVAVPAARLAAESLPAGGSGAGRGAESKPQPPMAAFFVGFALLAFLGPLAARFMHGASLIPELYAGGLLGVACPVTLDWAAGACIGVPIGEAWFVSMFKPDPGRGEQRAAPASPPSR